ncbi:MAG: glycerol-3-phosphate acyltransferase PlsX [Pelagibacterales bacterium]|nr:glycerol-3-phosphate acyltransferase PlsX [Pelagibacterales bacterium]
MVENVKIAIDAMGGDNSPRKIINGIKISLQTSNNNFFYLYGQGKILENELSKNKEIKKYCEIINTPDIIKDNESPLTAAKRGKNSSMWKAIESQKDKLTDISLSAGNTGALLFISRLILNCIDGINKPALAGLWPNYNSMSVVLDLGANIECDQKNLLDFTSMGSALYKSLFDKKYPKVALLNVGQEEIKGNEIIKKTFSTLKNNKNDNFEFCGYIEGNQIMDGNVDIIVTDGFTGNIALKTAEGTANFITNNLKKSLNKLSILLSYRSLKKFKEKLDPRKYNGAIFLGLQSPVVKSHGSTDSVGFAHSISLCNKIVKANLIEKIKANLIN